MLGALDRQMVASAHGEPDCYPYMAISTCQGRVPCALSALGRGQELGIVLGRDAKAVLRIVESRLSAMAPEDMSAMTRTIIAQSVVGAVLRCCNGGLRLRFPSPPGR